MVSLRYAFKKAVTVLYYLILRLKYTANASRNLITLATRVAAYVLSPLRGYLLPLMHRRALRRIRKPLLLNL